MIRWLQETMFPKWAPSIQLEREQWLPPNLESPTHGRRRNVGWVSGKRLRGNGIISVFFEGGNLRETAMKLNNKNHIQEVCWKSMRKNWLEHDSCKGVVYNCRLFEGTNQQWYSCFKSSSTSCRVELPSNAMGKTLLGRGDAVSVWAGPKARMVSTCHAANLLPWFAIFWKHKWFSCVKVLDFVKLKWRAKSPLWSLSLTYVCV